MMRTMQVTLLALAASLLSLASSCGGGGTTTIIGGIPGLNASVTVDPSCQQGTATVLANGVAVCQITLSASLDEAEPDFPAISVTVTGPAGAFFFSDPNTVVEPLSKGQAPRSYTVTFNPGTGVAPDTNIYIRSTASGPFNVTLQSASFLAATNVGVEFVAVPPPPTITPSVTVQTECSAGQGTVLADGIETCLVTLDLAMSPAQNGFQLSVTASGDSGLSFYTTSGGIGTGQNPRTFSVTFDALGDAQLQFRVRSTAVGQSVVTMQSGAALDTSAIVEFAAVPPPPGTITVTGVTVDPACDPSGTPTAEADGTDLCTVTVDLDINPDQAYSILLTASGPAGYLFYESAGAGVGTGTAPRQYQADFSALDGTAQVQIFARSITSGAQNLTISSSAFADETPVVEFVPITSPPTVGTTLTAGTECVPGAPTASDNGLDLCQITVDVTASADGDYAFVADGPAGYLFYDALGDPIDAGMKPKLFTAVVSGGTGQVTLFLRSTRSGGGTVTVDSSLIDDQVDVEFLADSTFTPPQVTVADDCRVGASTVQANGISVCKVTLSLSLSPPDPDFFDIAVSASGPGAFQFYESTGEALGDGKNPRLYSVSFDPVTGLATLEVFIRSTQNGQATVNFLSGGAIDVDADVEFAVDESTPTQLLLSAGSFVAGNGPTQVVATVLNGNSDPIPASTQAFTIDFTSNDANGSFVPAHPTIVRAGQDITDNSGEAIVDFDTTNLTAHSVTITAAIVSPAVALGPTQITIDVFDQLSAPDSVRYTVTFDTEGRAGNQAAATGAGVDAFFGDSTGTADIVQVDMTVRSIDEVVQGLTCNCDAGVDANGCTDGGEVACPSGDVQIQCPSGLGNPSQTQCKFGSTNAFPSDAFNTGCTGVANGSCYKNTCDGTAPCALTFYWRIASNSVARETGFSGTDEHPIIPRVLFGGTAISSSKVDRTDTDPPVQANSTVFLADPTLPVRAVFTAPFQGDAANRNCVVLTADPAAATTTVQCSDNPVDYTQVVTNPSRPRVPVTFNVENSLGNALTLTSPPYDTLARTFSFNGPSSPAPSYQICEDTSLCQTSDASGDISNYLTNLGDSTAGFLYPPFYTGEYGGMSGIVVGVNVPSQTGFQTGSKTVLVNPECTTPVALSCEFSSGVLGPAAPFSPTCYVGNGTQMQANGTSCVYLECTAESFGSTAAGMALGCTGAEVVDNSLFQLRFMDDGDADESESFCDADNPPCASGGFAAPFAMNLDAAGVAGGFIRIDNNQTAQASFSADFRVRLVRAGNQDLTPADMLQATPTFTVLRDSTLPDAGQLQVARQDSGGSPITAIYSQYVTDEATDIINQYGIASPPGLQDPFAGRLLITFKQFSGADYTAPAGNPTCTVTLSASGTAQGTQFAPVVAGDCGALSSSLPLNQSSGTATVQACVVSDGVTSAATSTANITATLSNCTTGGPSATPLTVNSVVRAVRYQYNVRNTTGATVNFSGLQVNTNLDSVVFCKPSNSPDCDTVPQPEAFAPVDLLAGNGGAQGSLTLDETQLRALFVGNPGSGCADVLSLGPSQSRGVWRFDVSLHPDPLSGGTLTDRLDFTTAQADAVFSDAQIASFEINEYINAGAFCDQQSVSTVDFDIQAGTPVYFGAP